MQRIGPVSMVLQLRLVSSCRADESEINVDM